MITGGTDTGTTAFVNNANYSIFSDSDNQPYPSVISWSISKNCKGISPILYFKYIKSKFNFYQNHGIEARLKKLENAFNEAVENGQTVLAEKFLAEVDMNAKETLAFAKGMKYWISKTDLDKYKRSLASGHISDTLYKNYTRVIPKSVIKAKQKFDGIFDEYVIYHYYNEEIQKDLKNMKPAEKEKMKDPVLFGMIKGSDRLYYIADWEDEYCDLSFDDIIKFLGKDKKHKIEKVPTLATPC